MSSFREILAFAREHWADDPLKLLLRQQRFPDVDLRLVAQQLEGRRQAADKWPAFVECEDYFYPPKLNREQSSSEATARYKAQLFAAMGGGTLADLTGGMGVDSLFMAREACHVDYYEVDAGLCAIAEYNFAVLGQRNVCCHCTDSLAREGVLPNVDVIYIDPARRDSQGRKVAAFEECTPNLLDNLDRLLSHCRHLLVKASPMIDIRLAVRQLGEVSDIHIVSVVNECKEVLFVVRPTADGRTEPTVHCVDLRNGLSSDFSFTLSEEEAAAPVFAEAVGGYLYEPGAALMKGGCYNLVGQRFGLGKLARNTHLYTSDRLVEHFPGRRFRVLQEVPLNAKAVKRLLPEGRAHVAVRNYPMSAAELQKKLKLAEGGTLFVLAATLATRPAGWLCELV